MIIPMVFGGTVGALAALAGMSLCPVYGAPCVLAASVVGAALAGAFPRSSEGHPMRLNPTRTETRLSVFDCPASQGDSANEVSSSSPGIDVTAPQGSVEPEWPVETQDVHVKLELAREYVELGESELAVQMLQEVLDLEIAVASKLAAEIFHEVRMYGSGEADVDHG